MIEKNVFIKRQFRLRRSLKTYTYIEVFGSTSAFLFSLHSFIRFFVI